METRETLERALAAAWDRDTLAVYADHLQAEGDLRGELIALDLEIEAHGNTVELSKRRTSLLYAWLGALVPVDNVHASWAGDSLKLGFVENLELDGHDPNALMRLEALLASPAGPYVRGMTLTGPTRVVSLALLALAKREHTWLTRLAIGVNMQASPIDPHVAAEAFRAMPRLESLELLDRPAFSPLSHPSIKRLAIRSELVYAALGDGASFDDVVELDLDLSMPAVREYWEDDYDHITPEGYNPPPLPKVAFPSLRRLDLTHAGVYLLGSAYRFLHTLDARVHITHLRIPQLRNASDRDELINVIRDMPALEQIEVAHGSYYDPPDIPNVRFVRAETWPWPTQELASGRGVRVYMPLAKYGDPVTLLDAVMLMERSYETLPTPARAAWSQLWRAIAALGKDRAPFPAHLLADAVDAFPALMENGWRELREELSARRPLAADVMVQLERCAV